MAVEVGPLLRYLSRQKVAVSLVVIEVAFGFLVISHFLLAGSWYLEKAQRPTGHPIEDLIAVTTMAPARSPDAPAAAAQAQVAHRADEALLRGLPGVVGVAPISGHLLDDRWNLPTVISSTGDPRSAIREGHPHAKAVPGWSLTTSASLPQVLGLTFVEGGPFPSKAEGAGEPVILTRSLRNALFGSDPALGQRIWTADAPPGTVIGVVEDVLLRMPFYSRPEFVALRLGQAHDEREARFLVRVAGGQRAALLPAIERTLAARDPQRRLLVRPYDPRLGRYNAISTGLVRFLGFMAGQVASMALLASFAVASFFVAQRTRHIGIARALGARRRDIVHSVLFENTITTAIGNAVGLGLALIVFRVMGDAFPGLELDWTFLAITAVLMWAAGIVASWLPARKAARTPPIVATRSH